MTDDEQSDAIRRLLLNQAEVIAQLRRDVDELASELADTATATFERLDHVENGGARSSTPRSWCWRGLGPRAEDELWSQLRAWVAWIRHRYPLAKRLPACWAEHPEIVEELTALWLAWHAAFEASDAPLTGPIDWHDRWLPGFLHRLEHGAFALDCTPHHQARPAHLYAGARDEIPALD